ncbi:phosphatase PAP2 family protein, partial [Vibrio echinoideorum]
PIYWLAKYTLKRRRPAELSSLLYSHIVPYDKYSLPSGHSAAAFVMASLIGHFYPSLYPFSVVWATAIAGSRILLGVHF